MPSGCGGQYATGWVRVDPPQGHDVLLPSWMAGQYKLYLPDVDDHNHAIDWKFQYWKERPSTHHQRKPYPVTEETRFVATPPAYMRRPESARVPDTSRPSGRSERSEWGPREYMVFHLSGEQDARTIVQVRDVLIETAPRATVTVGPADLQEWLDRPGHREASDLGNTIPALKGVFTLFADSKPCTRIWCEDHSVEFDDQVRVTFARATT